MWLVHGDLIQLHWITFQNSKKTFLADDYVFISFQEWECIPRTHLGNGITSFTKIILCISSQKCNWNSEMEIGNKYQTSSYDWNAVEAWALKLPCQHYQITFSLMNWDKGVRKVHHTGTCFETQKELMVQYAVEAKTKQEFCQWFKNWKENCCYPNNLIVLSC